MKIQRRSKPYWITGRSQPSGQSDRETPEKSKDAWDKLAALTPLIIGLLVTGVGATFTNIYNYRQLQLNQITALEKLRPLLVSKEAQDREFGYSAFVALGYEQIAIKIIASSQDQSGRKILNKLATSSEDAVKDSARSALKDIDEAARLVNKFEFGSVDGIASWIQRGKSIALEYGVKTKLGEALIADTTVQAGASRAKRIAEAVTAQLKGSPSSGVNEELWVTSFLEEREKFNARTSIAGALARRTDEFRRLINAHDWSLQTYTDPHD
jgi:hypothetical protein